MHLGVTLLGPDISTVKQKHKLLNLVTSSLDLRVILFVSVTASNYVLWTCGLLACIVTEQRSRLIKSVQYFHWILYKFWKASVYYYITQTLRPSDTHVDSVSIWLFQILWICSSLLSHWGSTKWSKSHKPSLYWLLPKQCHLWIRPDISVLWYCDATGTNQPVDILHWCITGLSLFSQISWLGYFYTVM